jgi:hypothetical protein
MVMLVPGYWWVVPLVSRNTYLILEPFTAVEAPAPPALAHARDEQAARAD